MNDFNCCFELYYIFQVASYDQCFLNQSLILVGKQCIHQILLKQSMKCALEKQLLHLIASCTFFTVYHMHKNM